MQTLIVGLDAFDATVFERMTADGKLPHLSRLAAGGGYARFTVANPPQSEVSWTSIATGLNPGGHGMFDFVHRDPANYALSVSLLPMGRGLAGPEFVPPHNAPTIFEYAVAQGFPATSLWWPATFPARPASPVRTLPGLGTPDVHGRLGVGTLFVTEALLPDPDRKTRIQVMTAKGKGRYTATLEGPTQATRQGPATTSLSVELELQDDRSARVLIGKQAVNLQVGRWSPIVELRFSLGAFASVHALTRVILSQVAPSLKLYCLPLQIHPLHPLWRYATPPDFVRDTWKAGGPFLTLGWPQDTTGLEDDCITDEQFLALCDSIFETRERILMHHLGHFREGLLASVFDTLDRVQHMFWRNRPEVVSAWYEKLDGLLGRVRARLAELGQDQARLIVVSDHGFTRFDHKVHLNRWLEEHGYLALRPNTTAGRLADVDWSRSTAYSLGLNSLYLNLAGREAQGSVAPTETEPLAEKLRHELLAWHGPDGQPVIQQVWRQQETFAGPLATYGPDFLIGYAAGYRASAKTGLGQWDQATLEPNKDHWGGDHCVHPAAVPAVVFATQDLPNFPQPTYHDIPPLAVGAELAPRATPPSPPQLSGEDKALVEERLKSLGYL